MSQRYEQLSLQGRKTLVMGLGTLQGGVGVARFLVSQGAEVTVTDLRTAEDLAPALEALGDLPVNYVLGEHRESDFDAAELIVRNPGVPNSSPFLHRARSRGVPIEMEMSLFFRACPAPIIGITGTKGKTTTATLCAAILERFRSDTVLAGNMGTSALDQLKRIVPDTPVVLELSSWQLEGLGDYHMSPEIAVLTNISEDHLNRYASMADYVEAKRNITRLQRPEDWFIVNRNDEYCWESRNNTQAQIVPFGVLNETEDGAGFADEHLYWRENGHYHEVIEAERLSLRGEHHILNCLAASAAALIRGATLEQVRDGLADAEPVPHRQEWVATIDGVDYINDTTATAPAAAIAALRTYRDRSIVLIAGGSSKGASLEDFADEVARSTASVVLIQGEETPNLEEQLRKKGVVTVSDPQLSMDAAVQMAAGWAQPGGVVLLSPACASFGMFRDEFHRGETFREAVQRLTVLRAGGQA